LFCKTVSLVSSDGVIADIVCFTRGSPYLIFVGDGFDCIFLEPKCFFNEKIFVDGK
jgi:hypothetical protein